MGKTAMLAMAGIVGLGFGMYGEALAHDHDGKMREKMEVTGPVTNLSGTCPNLKFTVATQQVATKDSTHFDDVECGEITNGLAVSAKGKVKDGVLMAYEVEAEN